MIYARSIPIHSSFLRERGETRCSWFSTPVVPVDPGRHKKFYPHSNLPTPLSDTGPIQEQQLLARAYSNNPHSDNPRSVIHSQPRAVPPTDRQPVIFGGSLILMTSNNEPTAAEQTTALVEVDEEPLLDVNYSFEIEEEFMIYDPDKGFCLLNYTRHVDLNVKFMEEEVVVDPICYDSIYKVQGE